jgi:DNA-binding NarL/FixJ family response regulator
MNALSNSYPSHHGIGESFAFRLALVYHGAREPTALLSILIPGGLPPTAGVLPINRAHELAVPPAQAAVVAADLDRPEGLSMIRTIHRVAPSVRIVVVARGAKDTNGILARQTLNAGADAFVPEHDAARALIPAVKAVVAGLVCVPHVARRLAAKPTFSHRENEVLELLVSGMTNRQIADRLYLAESTVKSHLSSAFAKLRVRSRKDATALLLDPEEGLWAATALVPGRSVDSQSPVRRLRADPQLTH